MKKGRVCELFGIEYPIIQGGMIWVSGAKLAAAVSNAGGLGLIGAGSMSPDLLREHIRKAKKLTDKPFGVNLPVFFHFSKEMIPVIIEEGVKIVFTSAGSPKKYTQIFHDNDIKVAHVASTPSLAKKCELAGVDAVVCEGFEAGGHNGREEITTFALVPQVVDKLDVPVIAAGGIADGRGIAAAFALGADGVQIGSRFVCASEASAHNNFKNAVLNAEADSTSLVLKSIIPVRLIRNEFCKAVIDAEQNGADYDKLSEMLGRDRPKMGMFDGNLPEGELEIGQVAGMIDKIVPAKDIVDELVKGYEEAIKQFS